MAPKTGKPEYSSNSATVRMEGSRKPKSMAIPMPRESPPKKKRTNVLIKEGPTGNSGNWACMATENSRDVFVPTTNESILAKRLFLKSSLLFNSAVMNCPRF